MYYSEQLQSPISEANCKRIYGINPVAPEARERGFYSLIEAPADTTPSHYIKEGDHYRAVPLPITNAELQAVCKLRKTCGVEAAAHQLIPDWVDGTTYKPGDLVEHRATVYRKADDADQSEPDAVAGGWVAA